MVAFYSLHRSHHFCVNPYIISKKIRASSLVPLLVQDYAAVTLVDIRYISSQMLSRHISFSGQDVLFLYSTLVLNSGTALQ